MSSTAPGTVYWGKRANSAPVTLWWTCDDEKIGPEMVATARAIEESQEPRRCQMLRQARVFADAWLSSLYDLAMPRYDRRITSWNVCAEVVGTAQSMVCRSPVKVTLETSNAEGSLQRQAAEATRWLYGVWHENRVAAEINPQCFFDAGVTDVGTAVVRVRKRRLKIERVFPDELIVSDLECIYGKPWQAFIRKFLPRHSVLKEYGDREDGPKTIAIKGVTAVAPTTGVGWAGDMIPVYEGWSVNGKRCVAVEKATLEVADWKHDFVPLVPMYIERPSAGYYGRGYVQQLMGDQISMYQINDAIDQHISLMSSAKWILEAADGIDPDDLDNEIATTLRRNKGAANPFLLVPESVPQHLLNERRELRQNMLNKVGLSEWAIKGQEPAQRSGVGMEIARDKERGRLLTVGNQNEDWHVTLAEICFALGPETAGEKYAGKGPEDKGLSLVDFKTVAKFLKDKPWVVKPYPISILGDTPDAKRKTVEGWLQAGLITGPVAMSLMEMPDTTAEASLFSAAREDIMWSIEQILEHGADGYRGPEPDQDLELGIRMMVAARLKARRQGASEETLDLLAQWRDEALELLKLQREGQPPVAVEQRPGVGLAPAQAVPVDPAAQAAQAAPVMAEAPPMALPPPA